MIGYERGIFPSRWKMLIYNLFCFCVHNTLLDSLLSKIWGLCCYFNLIEHIFYTPLLITNSLKSWLERTYCLLWLVPEIYTNRIPHWTPVAKLWFLVILFCFGQGIFQAKGHFHHQTSHKKGWKFPPKTQKKAYRGKKWQLPLSFNWNSRCESAEKLKVGEKRSQSPNSNNIRLEILCRGGNILEVRNSTAGVPSPALLLLLQRDEGQLSYIWWWAPQLCGVCCMTEWYSLLLLLLLLCLMVVVLTPTYYADAHHPKMAP